MLKTFEFFNHLNFNIISDFVLRISNFILFMKILGITPARGGSKSIYKKNINPLAGKPLIAWTIEAALQSKLLNEYLVSTEDSEISAVAKKYGAHVLDRPKELATDEATSLSVLQHVLKNKPADIVVLLQCTSPVREAGLIDRCIQQFLDSHADSLATGFVCKHYEWGTYSARRQHLEGWFHDDGSVYVTKAECIHTGALWGEKKEHFITTREQNFEIDDEFEFWLNEKILDDHARVQSLTHEH